MTPSNRRAALLVPGVLLLATSVGADTFTVDNAGDAPGDCGVPGQCTLRAAFGAAAANGVDDLIKLSQGTTYILSNGVSPGLDATGNVIEIAVFDAFDTEVASPFDTAIDAAGLARHFIVRSGATLEVRGVTLRGGAQPNTDLGGAIAVDNGGAVVLTDVIVAGNVAGFGGGLFAQQGTTATLDRTLISGNQVTNGSAQGGGIYNAGTLTLVDSTVAGNTGSPGASPTNLIEGGGIYNTSLGSVSMTRGGVVQHTVASLGGGIYTEGTGPGGDQLTLVDVSIHGNHTGNAGGGLHSEAGAGSALLDGVSLISNTAVGDGGGIRNESSDMVITNALIQANSSTSLRGGGVSHSNGMLTISSSQFLDNTALDTNTSTPGLGGGLSILLGAPSVSVSGSLFDNNSSRREGGAIRAGAGSLTVVASTFTNNRVTDQGANDGNGGAIFATGATLVVEQSDLRNNDAPTRGAGIMVQNSPGAVRIVDTNISDNHVGALPGDLDNGDGGGLYVGTGNASVTIVRSTLAGNTTRDEGGALATNGSVQIVNSTISGNSANDRGGAVVVQSGSLGATNVTFAGNSASIDGEVFLGANISLFNSILEHDTTDGVNVCVNSLVASSDYNMIESGPGENCNAMGANNFTIPEGLIDLDPNLQYNGGPYGLHTHALANTSSGIDAADPTLCDTGSDTDLDNRSAPRSVGVACDMGAFETGAAALLSSGRLSLSGIAQGAMPGVSVVIAGLTVSIDTVNGESSATVASNLAAAIAADSALAALGLQVVAIGSDVLIDDVFDAGSGAPDPGLTVTSSDFAAIPLLGPATIVALLAALPAVAFAKRRRWVAAQAISGA